MSTSLGTTWDLSVAAAAPRRYRAAGSIACVEAEEPVRVDLPLHVPQPLVVRAVVGVPPAGEVAVDVVLVREARDVRPHRGVEVADPRGRAAAPEGRYQ